MLYIVVFNTVQNSRSKVLRKLLESHLKLNFELFRWTLDYCEESAKRLAAKEVGSSSVNVLSRSQVTGQPICDESTKKNPWDWEIH